MPSLKNAVFAAALATLCWLFMLPVLSQDIRKYAGIDFQAAGTSEVEQPLNNDWDTATFRISSFRGYFTLPLVLKKHKTILFLRGEGKLLRNLVEGGPDPQLPENLYSASAQLGALHFLPKRWRFAAYFTPGFASNLNGSFDRKDVVLQGGFLLQKTLKADTSLVLGAGFFYSTVFGDALLMPTFKLYWRKQKFAVSMLLPQRLRLYWRQDQTLNYGFSLRASGNRYHINGAPLPDQQLGDFIRFSALTLGPDMQLRLAPNLYWSFSLGLIGARRYEVLDQRNNTSDHSLNGSLYARAGLFFGRP